MMTKAKGTDSPAIYIIAGFPSEEDLIAGYPLSGSEGQYLLRILSTFDMFDKVRIVNICPDDSETISPEYIISDLRSLKVKPKVVVTLSSDVTRAIIGPERFTTIKAMQGQIYDIMLDGEKYKLVPTYSPRWVLEELRLASDEDKYTLAPTEFAKSIYTISSIAKDEYVDVLSQKEIIYCQTFEQFLSEYLSQEGGYVGEEELAYDVETTAESIYDENLDIIGFSIARKNRGFYVSIKSLDKQMTDSDRSNTFSLLRDILDSHKVVVHNSMYERPLTLEVLGYEIPYEKLDDTLAMARLMLGGHVGAGLKLQAQTNCGYPNWEVDKDDYLDAARGILTTITSRFCDIEEYPDLESMISYKSSTKWMTSFLEYIEAFKNVCYKYYNLNETENLLNLICKEGQRYVAQNKSVPRVLPYSLIPERILCKYGAVDAIATIDIRDYYYKWMKKESTDEVDLFKGYEVVLKQMYAGYVLERNGAYWNDSIVNKKSRVWKEMAESSLRSLIKSPLIKDQIIERSIWKYYPRALSEIYPDIAKSQGYEVEYNRESGSYKLFSYPDHKRVNKDKIYDIEIPESVKGDIYDLMMEEVDTMTVDQMKDIYNPSSPKDSDIAVDMLDTDDFKLAELAHEISVFGQSVRYNLKVRELFNEKDSLDREVIHASHMISQAIDQAYEIDQNRDLSWKSKKDQIKVLDERVKEYIPIVCKNWRVRGALYNNTTITDHDLVEEPYNADRIYQTPLTYSFKIQIQMISDTFLMDELDDEYIRLSIKLSNRDKLKSEYGDQWNFERKSTFKELKELYKVAKPHSPKLISMYPSPLSSLDEETIIKSYEVYQYQGINPDDSSTWTPQFDWLINYRIYKKILKLLTSYVEGKVGRDTVYVVDKVSLQNGDKFVPRKGGYRPEIKVDEDYLYGAKWGVCTADTLRWRSGFHTIPWGSPVKKFYTSRYPGGTVVAPDYSQAEIRTLAASAKCEPMLEAFRNGADIHLTTAAAIFNKPPEQVLEVERRFSKMASFSILYGAQYENFANNYLAGDVDRAKQIYDGFFSAYPEIKKWTEDRHNEYKRTGKVSTLVNQFIVIAPGGPDQYQGSLGSALRKAGNYPIQNASSAVVACVLYEICRYIDRRGMKSKPFMFVHDSLEIDVHPEELVDLITEFRRLLLEIPNNQYGLPSKADFTLGFSLGHELKVEEWDPSDDRNSVTMVLEGYRDEIEDTINNWKTVYKNVDVIDIWHKEKVDGEKIKVQGYEPDYYSYDRLFILKRSYDEYVGTIREKGYVKIHIDIK